MVRFGRKSQQLHRQALAMKRDNADDWGWYESWRARLFRKISMAKRNGDITSSNYRLIKGELDQLSRQFEKGRARRRDMEQWERLELPDMMSVS